MFNQLGAALLPANLVKEGKFAYGGTNASLSIVQMRWFIFFITNAVWFLEIVIELRQLRHLIKSPNIPKILASILEKIEAEARSSKNSDDDEDKKESKKNIKKNTKKETEEIYCSSREYAIDKLIFGITSSVFQHLLGQWFLFGGPLIWAWNWSEEILKKHSFATGSIMHSLLWMACIVVFFKVASEIPIGALHSFYLEAKHGFNKIDAKTFIVDQIKNLFLLSLMGSLLLSLFIWVLSHPLSGGWSVVIIGSTFMLFLQLFFIFVFPTVIQPMFNKYTTLPEGTTIKPKIESLAKGVGFPLGQILVVDASKRSSHSNAYLLGLWGPRRIVLFDTLMEQLSEEEICAVLAHELGHWHHAHIFKSFIFSQFYSTVLFGMWAWIRDMDTLYKAFSFMDGKPVIVGLYLFFLLFSPISWLLGWAGSHLSRKREFEADRYAVSLKYGPSLAGGLVAISKENKGLIDPDSLYASINYSHPALTERLQAIEECIRKMD